MQIARRETNCFQLDGTILHVSDKLPNPLGATLDDVQDKGCLRPRLRAHVYAVRAAP